MIIFKKAAPLSLHLQARKKQSLKVGFVPTMGALHAGHLSLIHAGKADNDLVVCSIFVNPTQFNNHEDFKKYPNTIAPDIEKLYEAGCCVLFLPNEKEIYPAGYQPKHYDLGEIETIWEGHYRPGHFQGVCQVVEKLLDVVAPDNLYMGKKDYQQCMVVQKLVTLMGKENEIALHFVDTKREADGLAMSSRNMRLSAEQKKAAATISKTLAYLKLNYGRLPLNELKEKATVQLEENGFIIDYVGIADSKTLKALQEHKQQDTIALIAASIGGVRLIDNMILN